MSEERVEEDAPLRGDMSAAHAVDTASMEWTPSPSGAVWRKRLHRVGPAESGQVTSVVRYLPDSRFPPHDHPEGEEILVLDGVFSDEHGDWPAGTYLLNPEGFRHAPFSREGCLIFVKLRQYDGAGRHHVALQTHELPWEPGRAEGVERKLLYEHPDFPDASWLERWAPGAEPAALDCPDGCEMLVVAGALEDERGSHGEGSWLRVPPDGRLAARSVGGCELYVKAGGVASLRVA